MSDVPPIAFIWQGDGFTPANSYAGREADKHYTVGERYLLIEHHERSTNSHRHYFASLHEAWENLPERETERFPTSEHLRRYALIKTGFADEHKLVCSSKAEALRVAAFMKPVDEFSLVIAKEAVVTRYVAKSQSTRAMGKEEFQRSKTAVLDFVSDMIGTSRKALEGAVTG